jgi:hypothetical protein
MPLFLSLRSHHSDHSDPQSQSYNVEGGQQEKMGAVWNRMDPYETSPYFNHFLRVLWLFRVLCDHFLM